MLEFCKKHFYKLLLSVVYTVLACLVYGIWSYSAWQLWYVTFIIILLFIAVGSVIGYFWLKVDLKTKEEVTQETSLDAENKNEE